MDDDLTKRIKDLKELLALWTQLKELDILFNELSEAAKLGISKIKDSIKVIGTLIDEKLRVCQEMDKDSAKEGDYYKEAKKIREWINDLLNAQEDLANLESKLKVNEPRFKEIQTEGKKAHGDLKKMQQLTRELKIMVDQDLAE